MKCTKYSFNLTYNQESAKTLSFKYIHFPFVFVLCICLFVCLFFFFSVFAIFKDHAPIPSLFFQGIHLFLNSCLSISYRVSIWPHDEWVTGISIPGGGARCWTLGNFDSLCKVMMSRPVFAVKKPRARFFKNQYGKFISYSWSLSRIFSTVTVLLSFGDSYLKENNVCRENSDINLLVSLTNHPKPWCFEINNPG